MKFNKPQFSYFTILPEFEGHSPEVLACLKTDFGEYTCATTKLPYDGAKDDEGPYLVRTVIQAKTDFWKGTIILQSLVYGDLFYDNEYAKERYYFEGICEILKYGVDWNEATKDKVFVKVSEGLTFKKQLSLLIDLGCGISLHPCNDNEVVAYAYPSYKDGYENDYFSHEKFVVYPVFWDQYNGFHYSLTEDGKPVSLVVNPNEEACESAGEALRKSIPAPILQHSVLVRKDHVKAWEGVEWKEDK